MFQRGYRAGDKATVDLSEEDNQTLLNAFKAGFVHRRAQRAALATGNPSPAYMGQDAARRARLSAGDFSPCLDPVAMRDWAEVLGGDTATTPPIARRAPALQEVWSAAREQ